MDSQQVVQWLTSPAALKWALGVVGTALVSVLGFVMKNAFRVAKDKFDLAAQQLADIKQVTAVQAENHLSTIQKNTGETRDALLVQNTKLDVLITLLEKKI